MLCKKTNTITTHQLDARRLLCPLPVIKVQEQAKKLKAGDILVVIGKNEQINKVEERG